MNKLICILVVIIIAIGFLACNKSNNNSFDNCELIIEYNDGLVKGSVNYDYTVCDGVKNIVFNVYPNVIAGYENSFKINSAYVNSKECEWGYVDEKGQFLEILLEDNIIKNQKVDILIEFECFLKECDGRLGISNNVVNLAIFYPIPCVIRDANYIMQPYTEIGDPFYFDFYNFDITLTIPSTYVLATGAKITSLSSNGEKTIYLAKLSKARNFACSLSPNYHVVSKKVDNKRISYYYTDDNSPHDTLNLMISALDFFSEKIGEYCYENFTVATSEYSANGMEYSGFCVIKNGLNSENLKNTLIHEIAHQWFPISVSSNEYLSGYFDEGLAEYLTALFLNQEICGYYDKRERYAKSLFSVFVSERLKTNSNYLSVMKRELNKFESSNEYIYIAYEKSFLFFNNLNKSTNDNLIKYLAKFYKNNIFKLTDENDFYLVFGSKQKMVKEQFNKIVFNGYNYFVD